jgi:hypothetical protein
MNDAHSNLPENKMIGVWKLVSSEFRTSKGDVIHPLGENALGQLILTPSGYMSGQLMRPERPRFSGPDLSTGTLEEIKNAFEGFVSYYGPYEIDVENQKLITHVEGSLYPNWVGDDQIRFFELSENRLILKTLPIRLGEEEFVGILVWEPKTKGSGHV